MLCLAVNKYLIFEISELYLIWKDLVVIYDWYILMMLNYIHPFRKFKIKMKYKRNTRRSHRREGRKTFKEDKK